MYKLLLCWRYLRTRYIALASIISVTLGVATMIVVNSVMSGFAHEMQTRIHGIISDVVFESRTLDGMPDAAYHEEQIRQVAGDQIEAMSATVKVPAMLYSRSGAHPVLLFGIDEKTQSSVSDFGRYLQHPENRKAMSFQLRKGATTSATTRVAPTCRSGSRWAGPVGPIVARWPGSRSFSSSFSSRRSTRAGRRRPGPPPIPLRARETPENRFDPEKQQYTGAVLGIAMVSYRTSEGEDKFMALPGDDVMLTTVTVGQPPKESSDHFTIVDLYESKMSEYDSQFVFVPIRKLQELRGMIDPTTGIGRVNVIQIKLKPGANGDAVRDKLQAAFSPALYNIYTWRDNQSALLAAVQMESTILNVLLFLIVAVAGFGILAIFYMIVVEKTRDIGILKSLGAPGRGVMGIFLGYGLSLGMVGSGVGMVAGLLFVRYINEIAAALGWVTGRPVFDPKIYYFYKIPAIVMPQTVAWIVAGALLIAVAASILPARRAARLHPVEALRYE